MWKTTLVAIACGGFWLLAADRANSQGLRTFSGDRQQNVQPYFSASYASPPVSPYVNLGFNSNGVSNYQTLVRPLIDDRAALWRQSVELEQLNQQVRGVGGGNRRDVGAARSRTGAQSGVRFMHYSHYFGTIR